MHYKVLAIVATLFVQFIRAKLAESLSDGISVVR